MFVPFQSLPDQSRIWIYQSDRKFNSHEVDIISEVLTAFTEGWSVHGVPMPGSFDIRFDQFIILAADDHSNAASGCSIDDSVRTLKDLCKTFNIELFDRAQIAFKNEEKVLIVNLADLKKEYESGTWRQDSLTFNNLINTKAELASHWLVPASTTWLKRYIHQETVAVK